MINRSLDTGNGQLCLLVSMLIREAKTGHLHFPDQWAAVSILEQDCTLEPDVLVASRGRYLPAVPPGPAVRLCLLNLLTKFVFSHLGYVEFQQILHQGFRPIQQKALRSPCLHWFDKIGSERLIEENVCLSPLTYQANDFYKPPLYRELSLNDGQSSQETLSP